MYVLSVNNYVCMRVVCAIVCALYNAHVRFFSFSQVNQCELGRPKRNLRDIGSSENKGPSSRKGPGRP